MNSSFYEKEADAANYIYFQKNVITESCSPQMLPHFHDSIEFVFMLKGECLVHINTEERIVRQGEITFARCFEPHFYIPKNGAEYYVVLISSRYLKSGFDFSGKTFPSFMPENGYSKKISQLLDVFYSVWDGSDDLLKSGLSDTILAVMRRAHSMTEVRGKKTTQTFVEILKFINGNFRSEVTLEGLADTFGYSKTYLSGLFNQFTGMKLRDYVNRCRINEFYKLRREQPKSPVCRIAEEVGFNSLNTFYRVLHKYGDNLNF